MRTEIISIGLRGIVVVSTAMAILSVPAAGAPNPSSPASANSLKIVTNTNADTYQFAVGGDHSVSTIYTSDGTVVTTGDSNMADADTGTSDYSTSQGQSKAAVSAALINAAPAPDVTAATATDSGSASSDTIQPKPKSKFRKLIFAAAIVPATVFALVLRARRAAANRSRQWDTAELAPLPRPIAGITMGHIDSRVEQPTTPKNHPWYA